MLALHGQVGEDVLWRDGLQHGLPEGAGTDVVHEHVLASQDEETLLRATQGHGRAIGLAQEAHVCSRSVVAANQGQDDDLRRKHNISFSLSLSLL